MKILLVLLALIGLSMSNAYGQATGLTDLKFGQYQIADSQWNVSACTQTNTCQIYSKNPGIAYKIPWTSGQIVWAAGDYIAFTKTGDAANPWNAIQYSSNGVQKAVMGTGHIINIGADYFFFVGNDNNTGQLFSMTSGFSNSNGLTWTGTLNPTVAQVDSYATGGSTTPLAAGQTVAPAGPTVTGGTITQTNAPSNQVITSGGSSSAGITTSQQTRINLWVSKTIIDNSIYIDQVGNNNTITVTQIGNSNLITGIGQQAAQIQGDQNNLIINQGVIGNGKNEIDLRLIGSSNAVNLGQARNELGTAVGNNGHYQSLDIFGNSNSITTQQSNSGGVGGHYMETTVIGNSNIMTNKQLDNGNKIMFATVNGNNNSVNALQQGSGQHYLDYKLTGNNNSATVNQNGSTQNKATIDLTNAGGPATLNLTQGGGMNFSIQQSCSIVGGCTTTVNQP